MTIRQHGGVFGRNPKFNNVEAESLSIAGNAVPDASTILVDGDIGSTVQGYDADTAKYDDATANFTGTLQNGGSNVLVDTDIGSNVQGYDADTAKLDVAQTFTANQTFSTTSDGAIVEFEKDSVGEGHIGTSSDDNLFIWGSNTGISIGYATDSSAVVPCGSDGAIRDDVTDLGAADARYDDVYATTGTIQTSDRNEKQDIEELTEAEHRVAVAAKALLRKYRFISRVEAKGDDARIHFGIIAQDLQAAFQAEGLDASRYSMITNTTWIDPETGEQRSRMGVRYSELLAFLIAAL